MTQAQAGRISRFFQYIYFLRFPILLWISFAVLPYLDLKVPAVTRALFIMREPYQILYITFYVILAGWQALVAARLVCAYGGSRFETLPPEFLKIQPGIMSWKTFLFAQVPGVILLGRVYLLTYRDWDRAQATGWKFFLCGLLGAVLACVFWYALAYLYAYIHPPTDLAGMDAFLLPITGRRTLPGRLLEDAAQQKPHSWPPKVNELAGRLVSFAGPGYLESDGRTILTGQYFATLLLIALVLLYFALAFITYPLPRGGFDVLYSHVAGLKWPPGLCSILLAVLLFAVSIVSRHRAANTLARVCSLASLFFLFLWIAIAREPAFPALATIIVLASALLSLFAGVAYAFDRYRIPAIMPVLIWILAVQFLSHPDHIFYPAQSGAAPRNISLETPRSVLQSYSVERPWIVVTATGGGIHSAVWTSTVLAKLEEAFCKADPAPDDQFHRNIVFMSSVSGGSIAIANWMREYAYDGAYYASTGTPVSCTSMQLGRLSGAARQASVEAIAWGLLHYDLYHVLLPFVFSDRAQDRGWFLEQSLLLNHYRAYTGLGGAKTVLPDRPEIGTALWNQDPTLLDMAVLLEQRHAPAFTVNATVMETGERYLMGNYAPGDTPSSDASAPAVRLHSIDPFRPALSFLTQYRGSDLSLEAAARLSASFPYVSPMARPDIRTLCSRALQTDHLADGGYYDNDGVATAAEFLWLGLGPVSRPASGNAEAKPLPTIWLIQIRDSPLPPPSGSLDTGQQKGRPCGPLCGLLAPLATLYSSGHVADPERNQRALAVLDKALAGRANLHTIVFDYEPPLQDKATGKTCGGRQDREPSWTTLNWLLSNRDQCEINLRWKQIADDATTFAREFSKPEAAKESTAARKGQLAAAKSADRIR